jgi:transmembrane sensor
LKLDNGALAYRANPPVTNPSAARPLVYGYNTISTPRGGQYQVLLPDGSKVWLDAASSLRFPTAFTGGERLVELTGEAYFQIAGDASRPFKVHIPSTSTEIQVLGTDFNVAAYAEEGDIRTTLIGGAVRVTAAGKAAVLEPGQQARVTEGGTAALNVVSGVHTDDVIAWKNGLFKFEEASIQSIMRQVARWYDVDVVYDGKVDQQFIGTIPRQVQLSTLLKILESTGWVHFMIQGKKVTVTP